MAVAVETSLEPSLSGETITAVAVRAGTQLATDEATVATLASGLVVATASLDLSGAGAGDVSVSWIDESNNVVAVGPEFEINASGVYIDPFDELPTAAENAAATWAVSTEDLSASGTVGKRVVDNLDAAVSDVQESITGVASDINIEIVHSSRVFVLVPTSQGLRSEDTKVITIDSDPQTYAVDFRNDAGANQKIYSVESVAILSGTAGGVTFGTAGREGQQAKFRITGVTEGNYVVRVEVKYGSAAGPTQRGDILIKVVE